MGVHRAPRPRRLPPLLAPLLVVLAALSATPASATPASDTYLRLAQLTPAAAGTELVVSSVADPSRSVTIPGVGYGSVTPTSGSSPVTTCSGGGPPVRRRHRRSAPPST